MTWWQHRHPADGVRANDVTEEDDDVTATTDDDVTAYNDDVRAADVTADDDDDVTAQRLSCVQVFQEVQSLVTSCIDGFHVCIFAYGQTGSGKTFTMEVRAGVRGQWRCYSRAGCKRRPSVRSGRSQQPGHQPASSAPPLLRGQFPSSRLGLQHPCQCAGDLQRDAEVRDLISDLILGDDPQ